MQDQEGPELYHKSHLISAGKSCKLFLCGKAMFCHNYMHHHGKAMETRGKNRRGTWNEVNCRGHPEASKAVRFSVTDFLPKLHPAKNERNSRIPKCCGGSSSER